MKFCVLSSGSKANCVYVEYQSTRILIDCGLSGTETARRLRSIGVLPETIDAIFITHEHRDHIAGVATYVKRFETKVIANHQTMAACRGLRSAVGKRFQEIEAGGAFQFKDLYCEPFSVMHDAVDPVMFRIGGGDYILGVVTDLGQLTSLVRERTRNLSALVLESNHDLDMLFHVAPYPWELKQRISGNSGHLSNADASLLVKELSAESKDLQVLVAAHISEKSNYPELALDGFKQAWVGGEASYEPVFYAASVNIPSPLFNLSNDFDSAAVANI